MHETVYRFDVPVRIALLSDLHDRPCEGVLSSLMRHRPEIICIAGDLFQGFRPWKERTAENYSKNVLSVLEACRSVAPVFLSLGNHEWMLSTDDTEWLRSLGCTVLDNSWVCHGDLVIGGLTSAHVSCARESIAAGTPNYPKRDYFHKDTLVPDLSWLDAFERQPGYRILLSHHPEYSPRYLCGRKIDMILSGHAHGGQIRLFGQGLFSPGQGLFPKYTSGVHGNMIISRGLSNTGGPVPRIFNAPEIVYIVPLQEEFS